MCCQVSMATDLCQGACQPNFVKKTTENDQSSNACQSFRINVKAVKRFGLILQCMYLSAKRLKLPYFGEGKVEKSG